MTDYAGYIEHQKAFFKTNITTNRQFRIDSLNKLAESMKRHEEEIYEAFWQDLHKPKMEVFLTEYLIVMNEIKEMTKHLKRWTKEECVMPDLTGMCASKRIIKEPFGCVYVVGPFNYPLQLAFVPLIGAVAAGNCVILKSSKKVPNIARVMGNIITDTFPPEYVVAIDPEAVDNKDYIKNDFDMIFFTGSPAVGKEIMKAAAENLAPVVLELGGKSPAIVLEDADISNAAQKIVWSKFTNAGQTCVASDYVLVQNKVAEKLVKEIKKTLIAFYSETPEKSASYCRIVDAGAVSRLSTLIDENQEHLIYGGKTIAEEKFISPTLFVLGKDTTSTLMDQELFGPLLPIIVIDSFEEAKEVIAKHPTPLAAYLFTKNKEIIQEWQETIQFGGGGINETLLHSIAGGMPFGGVGNSGLGSYHGKYSIEAFTHKKGIIQKRRFGKHYFYPPYQTNKISALKALFRI